jgi:group I intron endonuclease
MCGVYKITCDGNNKIYIGSSSNIEKRFKTHLRQLRINKHINNHLLNSYKIYGEESLKFEIVEECDELSMLEREQYWMDLTKCYDREIGFNNTIKSDRPTGYKHTEENKLKMSFLKKGKPMHPNTKKALMGKKRCMSDETKRKISISKIGDKNPNWGKKEDLDKKQTRMVNMLATPRWNTGKKLGDDPRIEKLRTRLGEIPHNAIQCKLVDLVEDIEYCGTSMKDLSKNSPLSLSTINRLKNGNCSEKITNKYKYYES